MEAKQEEFAAQMAEAEITDQWITEWEDRIGLDLRVGNVFNQNVSYESIRNFSNGIGDSNPLYRDPEYARDTQYGALVAPPSWPASVFPHWVLQGLPGVHADHSASEWEFLRPVYVNDKITPKCKFVGFDTRTSKFAGKTVFEYQRFEYWNQRDELVSRGYNLLVRYERQTAKKQTAEGRGKYDHIEMPHKWTAETQAKVDQDCLAEEIRGNKTRYWEEVNVGDDLTPVVKGIFGITDMIAYCVGAAPVQLAAHGVQLRNYRKHPAWCFRDPVLGAWEPVYGVHYLVAAAKGAGAHYAYDVGVQRHCWMVNLFTNWMGDRGWLKSCNAQYRQFVYLSDAVWFGGKVSRKYVDENGEYCVDIDAHGINQRGDDTIPTKGTVILPSRDHETDPVTKRLPPDEYRGTGKGVFF
ncbi:MAG: MaoC family dehydratase N-terminal domain-containing protein [Deltaproteobacteria bacterium]|jgi:acyl dehydratase|nr:MaoC family dehydratase N-terminal domain-containing protein [Deltaproteobacteria bacterium]